MERSDLLAYFKTPHPNRTIDRSAQVKVEIESILRSEGNKNTDPLCVARKYIVSNIVVPRLHVILSSVVLLIVRPESRGPELREVRCWVSFKQYNQMSSREQAGN